MPIERTELFNRERILWCCQQNRVTLDQISEDLKISPATLEAAIHGGGGLTISQLQRVAAYFHRNLLFFFETGEVDEKNADSAQFRTINNQKPELARKVKILVKRAEEQRQVFIDLLDDTEDYVDTDWTRNRIQKTQQETIKVFASKVREWLGIGNKNSFDSYRTALERAGVLVFVTNGYAGNWQIAKESSIRGFSLYFDSYPVIVAKKQDSPAAQSFTVMHELAHLILHKTSSIDEEKDFYVYQGQEKEANEFAGNVLVPDYLLKQIDLNRFPLSSVIEYDDYLSTYRRLWGVSGDVIVRRLRDEGLLEQFYYEEYLGYKRNLPRVESSGGGNRYRDKEPLNIFGSTFVSVVFEALHSEQITVNKASKYLDNLKISDLRKLEQRIVYI